MNQWIVKKMQKQARLELVMSRSAVRIRAPAPVPMLAKACFYTLFGLSAAFRYFPFLYCFSIIIGLLMGRIGTDKGKGRRRNESARDLQ